MKHPAPEQWMDWLYQELPSEQHRELDAHLAMCADCRQQVDAWRQTMGALDEWQVPAPARITARTPMLLRWAAAAAVVLGIGIGLGRLTAPPVDTAALRAEWQADLRGQLAALQAANERARAQDQATFAAALDELDEQHTTAWSRLREDLETVALAAENRLYQTERQIVQLVNFTPATNDKPTP
jgi:hypothetical protein